MASVLSKLALCAGVRGDADLVADVGSVAYRTASRDATWNVADLVMSQMTGPLALCEPLIDEAGNEWTAVELESALSWLETEVAS